MGAAFPFLDVLPFAAPAMHYHAILAGKNSAIRSS